MTDTPTDQPVKPHPGELFLSLTGFDEIAIARAFGAPVAKIREDESTLLRVLAFVLARRDGMKDTEAHEHALNLTLGTLGGMFDTSDDEDDLDALDAEGEQP